MPKSHQIPKKEMQEHVIKVPNIKKSQNLKNKKHLRASSDPPFFSVSICGKYLKVIPSQSIAEISDKIEWLLVMISSKVWFGWIVCGVFATFLLL